MEAGLKKKISQFIIFGKILEQNLVGGELE